MVVKYPKFSPHRITIISTVCVVPLYLINDINLLYGAFIPVLILVLSDYLGFIVNDFNHTAIYPFLASGLAGLSYPYHGRCKFKQTNYHSF